MAARSLKAGDALDFDRIPYLAIKGDYTVTSQQCQDSVDAINARRALEAALVEVVGGDASHDPPDRVPTGKS